MLIRRLIVSFSLLLLSLSAHNATAADSWVFWSGTPYCASDNTSAIKANVYNRTSSALGYSIKLANPVTGEIFHSSHRHSIAGKRINVVSLGGIQDGRWLLTVYQDDVALAPSRQFTFNLAQTCGQTKLAAPDVSTNISGGSLGLSWDAVPGATNYDYRVIHERASIKTELNQTRRRFNVALDDRFGRICVYVVANAADKLSSAAGVSCETVPAPVNNTPLATPATTIQLTLSTLNVNWQAVPGAVTYDVSMSVNGQVISTRYNIAALNYRFYLGSRSGNVCVHITAKAPGRINSARSTDCETVQQADTVAFGIPGCSANSADKSSLSFTISNRNAAQRSYDLSVGSYTERVAVNGNSTATYTLKGIANGTKTATVKYGAQTIRRQAGFNFTCDRSQTHPMTEMAQTSLPILSIRFLPDGDGDGMIDYEDTNYIGTVDELRNQIAKTENEGLWWSTEITRPLGRLRANEVPRLGFDRVDTIELVRSVPKGQIYPPNMTVRPDYMRILNDNNICDYVDNRGVKEVWMWTQHQPKVGYIEPAESVISSSYPSLLHLDNSEAIDLPVCLESYTLYNYNFTAGATNMLHNRGHQAESLLEWRGINNAFRADSAIWGSFVSQCGNTHFPANGIRDYDYSNRNVVRSSCESWLRVNRANSSYNCETAGNYTFNEDVCGDNGLSELAYLNWMFQHFPGDETSLDGKVTRNWWDIFADANRTFESGRWLILRDD